MSAALPTSELPRKNSLSRGGLPTPPPRRFYPGEDCPGEDSGLGGGDPDTRFGGL